MSQPTSPLFSIITPTFNSGPKLERTIESVLSQDPDLLEYFVLDGGSSDGTVTLLQQYAGRLTWSSRPDRGVYDAMNQGVRLSSGRYLYFLGAGDILLPDILRTLAPRLPGRPDVFAYGNVRLESRRLPFNGRYGRWKLSRTNICHQAVFCERHVFDRVGLFDLNYPVLADYVFTLKCFGDPAIQKVYLGLTVAEFEIGGLSATHRDGPFLQDRLALFRKYLGFWPYAANKAISLIPADLKEKRYQWYRRLRRHGKRS